jgi:hypothetical protein
VLAATKSKNYFWTTMVMVMDYGSKYGSDYGYDNDLDMDIVWKWI